MKYSLPTVLLNNNILLPKNEIKLEFDSEINKNIISEAEFFHDNMMLISYKLNKMEERPKQKEISNVGVIAKIIQKIDLPNGKTRVIIKGIKRVLILEYLNIDSHDETIESIVTDIPKHSIEYREEEILIEKLYKELEDCVHTVPYISNSFLTSLSSVNNMDDITDLIVPNLPLSYERLLDYLKETDCIRRFEMLLQDIYSEKKKFDIEKSIDLKIKQDIDESQRQYLLREKIKMLQEELGDTSLATNEVEKMSNSVKQLDAPDYILERLQEEISRYETMTSSFESSIVRNYIDYLLKLPWNKKTIDNDDLQKVMCTLDKKHYGMDEVKVRIIEYLAVKKMSKNVNSPVICLVGPPGVGKTTFAYNIATSLGRKFVKITVGGVNDPAEIVGHRRTYLGAAPGRIIQGLKRCESSNPVFLIDEIDKMGKDVKGDPVNVLLEVLDRTQNKHFSDNYIEEEYDLSDVFFIVTANNVDNISPALKDRLEIINIEGCTEQEKLDICRQNIIPSICDEHKLDSGYVDFSEEAILEVIRYYTNEEGVRELERKIAKIIRKIVKSIVVNKIKVNNIKITVDNISKYLGPRNINFIQVTNPMIGKVYSVAYTKNGGDMFAVEANYYKGSSNLILTGNVGKEIKESALVALDYIKAHTNEFGIKIDELLNNDVHINLPRYEISKDGSSIGCSLATAIISAFKKKKISTDISMTGELSLLGEVLPVGNIEVKIETAVKNNIKTIFVPKLNEHELTEQLPKLNAKIKIVFVENYKEIFEYVFK